MRGTIFKTKNGELYQCYLGRLAVVVSGTKPITDAAWDQYIQLCREGMNKEGMPKAVLNYSPIQGPNAAQRKHFNATLAPELEIERVALISDMALVRGALIALSWFSPGRPVIRPFSPSEIDPAMLWLREITDFTLDDAHELLRDLVREQGDDPVGLLGRPRRAQRI